MKQLALRAGAVAITIVVVATFLVASFLTVGACTAFDDLVVPDDALALDGTTPSTDGGADSGPDVDPCNHAVPPLPPTEPAVGGDVDFTVVIRKLTTATGPDGGTKEVVGHDLDGVCTCAAHATVGAASCVHVDGGTHCDGPNGRDNSTAILLAEIAQLGGKSADFETLAQSGIDEGRTGLLIRVQNYNGQPNDSQVNVSLFRSHGPYDVVSGEPHLPTFAADEPWAIVESSYVKGSTTPAFAAVGYVRDNFLVANLSQSVLPIDTAISILLNDGTVSARIIPPSGTTGYTLEDGLLTGRWPTSDLLVSLSRIQSNGERLCDTPQGQIFFGILRDMTCAKADINGTLKNDNTNALCNALSFGIGFRATPATIGKIDTEAAVVGCLTNVVTDCPQ